MPNNPCLPTQKLHSQNTSNGNPTSHFCQFLGRVVFKVLLAPFWYCGEPHWCRIHLSSLRLRLSGPGSHSVGLVNEWEFESKKKSGRNQRCPQVSQQCLRGHETPSEQADQSASSLPASLEITRVRSSSSLSLSLFLSISLSLYLSF